jgi:hypothetical protein
LQELGLDDLDTILDTILGYWIHTLRDWDTTGLFASRFFISVTVGDSVRSLLETLDSVDIRRSEALEGSRLRSLLFFVL